MKRKLLSILLTLILCLTLLPATALAAENTGDAYPVTGGNIYISYDTETGVYYVSGCEKSVTAANIPDQVNGHSISEIGSRVFEGCENLTSVSIPDSVNAIRRGAFRECKNLTEVVVPNSVTILEEFAFDQCAGLTKVVLPDSLTSIEEATFQGCTSLSEIVLPGALESIGGHAFFRSGLTGITLPNSLISIGEYAFGLCTALTSVTLPNSLTSISEGAFYSCTALTSVTLPNSLTSIGDGAFQNSGITKVTIPASAELAGNPFAACFYLKEIIVAAGNPRYTAENGVLFNKDKTELIAYPTAIGGYTIPDGVTTIGYYAFQEADLAWVAIPTSVTSIGEGAFYYCTGLTDFYYAGTSEQWSAIEKGKDAFRLGDRTSYTTHMKSTGPALHRPSTEFTGDPYPVTGGNIYFDASTGTITGADEWVREADIPATINGTAVTSIGEKAFLNCNRLTDVTIPSSVTSIGTQAFGGCGKLTNVVIPEGVKSLGAAIFDECGSLVSVTIPSSVTDLHMWKTSIFGWGCDSLTDIYYCGSEAQWRSLMESMGKDPDYTFEWLDVDPDQVTLHYNSAAPAGQPTEKPSSWAAADVEAAVAAGIVPESLRSGYTKPITRGEFCALAVKLYETVTGKEITGRKTFTDTQDVNVEKLASLGIVDGVGDGSFQPDKSLTREQAAKLLAVLADVLGKPMTAKELTFADNASIAGWAAGFVGQVLGAEIMNGKDGNLFDPKGSYTREQSIATMMRMLDYVS